MDAPPATTGVHILKHQDIWSTVEWDDHGKVRRAAAHAPDDEVLPPPRGEDCLRLAARVPHTPEAACEALHYVLYWVQGAPAPPPPGTHPSVDTPRHPLHGPDAPPRSRHRAPAPHLAHRPT